MRRWRHSGMLLLGCQWPSSQAPPVRSPRDHGHGRSRRETSGALRSPWSRAGCSAARAIAKPKPRRYNNFRVLHQKLARTGNSGEVQRRAVGNRTEAARSGGGIEAGTDSCWAGIRRQDHWPTRQALGAAEAIGNATTRAGIRRSVSTCRRHAGGRSRRRQGTVAIADRREVDRDREHEQAGQDAEPARLPLPACVSHIEDDSIGCPSAEVPRVRMPKRGEERGSSGSRVGRSGVRHAARSTPRPTP